MVPFLPTMSYFILTFSSFRSARCLRSHYSRRCCDSNIYQWNKRHTKRRDAYPPKSLASVSCFSGFP
uniref:Uncharacterized protein n=1 Tax=Aegilops tauschii subsp. strangulata TaxID=200361 RepID=A0A453MHG9_AEGTS